MLGIARVYPSPETVARVDSFLFDLSGTDISFSASSKTLFHLCLFCCSIHGAGYARAMYGQGIDQVVPFGYETISGWKEGGNKSWYMYTSLTYLCLLEGEKANGAGKDKGEDATLLAQGPFTPLPQCDEFLKKPL